MAKAKARTRRPPPKGAPPPKKPFGKWITYGIVGAGVVGLVALMLDAPEEIPEEIPDGTESVAIVERNHVAGTVDYDRAVPAGGNHNEVPLTCGIYESPVVAENAVHSLEHGAVWITYRPDIGGGAIDTLTGVARARSKTILSPVADQPSPIMATAWGWQLELQDADDIRLRQFVQRFEGAPTVPEPGAPCIGVAAHS